MSVVFSYIYIYVCVCVAAGVGFGGGWERGYGRIYLCNQPGGRYSRHIYPNFEKYFVLCVKGVVGQLGRKLGRPLFLFILPASSLLFSSSSSGIVFAFVFVLILYCTRIFFHL